MSPQSWATWAWVSCLKAISGATPNCWQRTKARRSGTHCLSKVSSCLSRPTSAWALSSACVRLGWKLTVSRQDSASGWAKSHWLTWPEQRRMAGPEKPKWVKIMSIWWVTMALAGTLECLAGVFPAVWAWEEAEGAPAASQTVTATSRRETPCRDLSTMKLS